MADSISKTASPAGKKSASPNYSKSIAAVRVVIDPNHSTVMLPARGDKPERERYSQRAIVIGTPSNIPFSINSYDRNRVYEGGLYCLTNECLRTNQYGQLELNPFGQSYHRLGDLTDDHRRLLQPEQTHISDYSE